ncbi:MAG TPA: phenylalanine--tRNA ligase subunit beta [Bacteroidia bacterium]|jgi:phenylalanyl-tRNA synthetase beta chain|nr:phenylalanine--tRNA ligase subunit beta [Bacteroidia bacterium]
MKISHNWLKTLINIDSYSAEQIAVALTNCGLEVESTEKFEQVKGMLQGVVVGHVLEKIKHPNADKLSLTKVDVGNNNILSIVCGAPNVDEGQKVLVAMVGSILHTTNGEVIEIKKSKIRGEGSEGMICAEDEIGLGENHDGIKILPNEAPVGKPAAEYLNLYTDTIFEVGLTPNRGDAASHYGVARDLAAVINCKNNNTETEARLVGIQDLPEASGVLSIDVKVEDAEACPRYCGVTISGIKVDESPEWLKNNLKAIGLRPINNIVDITNFVLHETGQPLHAFEAFAIEGKQIIVRKAKQDEHFVTLDSVERKLNVHDLVIANVKEAMCIAGVFGGLHSGVNEKTTAIFLESAYFNPTSVRKTSRHLGIKTDSSFRFERGADPEMTVNALKRAAHLIMQLAGGQTSSALTDIYTKKLEPVKVGFSFGNCDKICGKEIDRTIIKNIIKSTGIEIVTEGADGLLLHVPRFKYDVTREIDVIEEVMRIYGLNNIPSSEKISFSVPVSNKNNVVRVDKELNQLLSHLGFCEMMATSLTKGHYMEGQEDAVPVMNPLSADISVLRNSMIYGMLEAVNYNINRKNEDLKLYEFGRSYHKQSAGDFAFTERKTLALIISGNKHAASYHIKTNEANFYTLKAFAESILSRLGIDFNFTHAEHAHLSGAIQYTSDKKILASLGLVNHSLLKTFDIGKPVYYAEFYLDALYKLAFKPVIYNEPAKFPAVKRDLALLLDKAVTYAQLEKTAFETERKLLKEVNLFDVYEGDKIPKGKKSYALSFTLLNPEATLTDKQIEGSMEKLLKAFEKEFSASIR